MGKIEGVCRTIAVPVEVIGLIGWCGYVIGFSLTTAKNAYSQNITTSNNSTDPGHRLDYDYTCYWFFLVVGLLMNVVIFVHLNVAHRLSAVLMNFFVALCLASGGAIVQIDGTYFFNLITASGLSASRYFQEPHIWILVEFVGVCTAVVSLIVYMLLWPCIEDSKECCKKKSSVAPDGDVFFIQRTPLAFEEQPPKRKPASSQLASPKPGSPQSPLKLESSHQRRDTASKGRADSFVLGQFTEIGMSTSNARGPSAPPIERPVNPWLDGDRMSFTEDAPNDTNKLVG